MIYYNYPPHYYSPFHHYPNRISNNSYTQRISKIDSKNDSYTSNNLNSQTSIAKNSNHKNISPLQISERKDFPREKTNSNTDDKDAPLFEVFGIKLYFDDILLICLIFFLYTEGVEDQYLFIALILLLLS